jgi:UDP-N-acetylmuramoylalanine--D-glutamate ligase
LKANSNILWLLGGINKKGDKFNLKKKELNNVRAFIYGKNKNFFNKQLKNKLKSKNFNELKDALKSISYLVKREKLAHSIILFSPCAASFDNFKNFEDRGLYFNQLVKKYFNGK